MWLSASEQPAVACTQQARTCVTKRRTRKKIVLVDGAQTAHHSLTIVHTPYGQLETKTSVQLELLTPESLLGRHEPTTRVSTTLDAATALNPTGYTRG